MKPYSSEGPRPPPHFPGHQEFFREFIMAVDNVSFIEHLKDNLVSHLIEMDHTDFCASDVEESGEDFISTFLWESGFGVLVSPSVSGMSMLFKSKLASFSDSVVDEETRQAYINCVTTMQLLAKFLGFIVFLPYQKAADIPRNIIESELAMRSKVSFFSIFGIQPPTSY